MTQLHRSRFETPVGPMRAIASDEALWALEFFVKDRMTRLDVRLARWGPGVTIDDGTCRVLAQTREWLDGYFAGVNADTSALTLAVHGGPFELLVWGALRRIPPGATTTYGAVAREIGAPHASRAVGMANGANPIAIIVPCHRVIGANGTLTGYGGGLRNKSWLLNHERRWAHEPALF